MKIAVFGTPEISAKIFESLFEEFKKKNEETHKKNFSSIEIIAAVTAPDRPAGRGKKHTPPPVKVWAEKKGIPIFQPEKMSSQFAKEIKNLGTDLFLVISFGKIFSQKFLDAAPEVWNLHFSLLPEFRGASPVPAAILAGKKISGVSIFQIQAGMDDGPIVKKKEVEIENLRADDVFEKMVKAGGEVLSEIFQNMEYEEICAENNVKYKIQNSKLQQDHSLATFCGKIEKQDGFLEPKKITAEEAFRKILAYHPWPGTWIDYQGKRLKILNAKKWEGLTEKEQGNLLPHCLFSGELKGIKSGLFLGFRQGVLKLTEVQLEGKKALKGEEFAKSIR